MRTCSRQLLRRLRLGWFWNFCPLCKKRYKVLDARASAGTACNVCATVMQRLFVYRPDEAGVEGG
jgi:hypothetical protein